MSDDLTAAPGKSNAVEDILEVLVAPAKVFDRARNSSPGIYIALLSVLTIIIVFATKGLLAPYIDANFDLQLQLQAAKGKPIPPEAVAAGRSFGMYGFLAASVFTIPIGALISGFLIWIGGKLVRADLRFGQAALIATLASVTRPLSFLATAVQGAFADPQSIRSFADASLGPGRFVDPTTTSPALQGLLANLDVFNLWQLVLLAIGISVIARVSRSTGAIAAIIAWGIGAIATMLPALVT